MANDVTFIVHGDWVDFLAKLDIDTQDKILADLVRYGTNRPLKHEDLNDPTYYAMLKALMPRIDFSKDKWEKDKVNGKKGGRPKTTNDEEIWLLAQEGKSAQEIAEILHMGVSTVQHREGWRKRKEAFLQ